MAALGSMLAWNALKAVGLGLGDLGCAVFLISRQLATLALANPLGSEG